MGSGYLKQGSRGDSVQQVQKWLEEIRENPGPVDSIYGPKTEAAIRTIQKKYGLKVDGIAGPATIQLLKRLVAGDTVTPIGAPVTPPQTHAPTPGPGKPQPGGQKPEDQKPSVPAPGPGKPQEGGPGWTPGQPPADQPPKPQEPVVTPPAGGEKKDWDEKGHQVKTREEAAKRYGKISGKTWADEEKWLVKVPVPEPLRSKWRVDGDKDDEKKGSPLTRIRCNKDMAGPLERVMKKLVERNLVDKLYSYEGCFNIRNVKGGSSLSCHAYGLALDMNYEGNTLGDSTPAMPKEIVACFKEEGFTWGGDFKGRKDGMHFSRAWE